MESNSSLIALGFYCISTVFYYVGLFYGIKSWIIGSELFKNSSPKYLFEDSPRGHIEKIFYAVFFGSLGNLGFCIVMPIYIFNFTTITVGALEPGFLVGHVFLGGTMVFWHKNSIKELKKFTRGIQC